MKEGGGSWRDSSFKKKVFFWNHPQENISLSALSVKQLLALPSTAQQSTFIIYGEKKRMKTCSQERKREKKKYLVILNQSIYMHKEQLEPPAVDRPLLDWGEKLTAAFKLFTLSLNTARVSLAPSSA